MTDDKVLKSPDKHKWKNNICVRCGCERHYYYGVYVYSRSGQHYEYAPLCIDWDIENSKTID